MNKEDYISHIAYFRTDGGSCRLYTEEYVDYLQNKIDKAIEYIKELDTETTDMYEIAKYVKNELLEILGDKE